MSCLQEEAIRQKTGDNFYEIWVRFGGRHSTNICQRIAFGSYNRRRVPWGDYNNEPVIARRCFLLLEPSGEFRGHSTNACMDGGKKLLADHTPTHYADEELSNTPSKEHMNKSDMRKKNMQNLQILPWQLNSNESLKSRRYVIFLYYKLYTDDSGKISDLFALSRSV